MMGKRDAPQHDHGGCGNLQPSIRRKGLQLIGTYSARKGEDDEGPAQSETRTITPAMALNIFRHISVPDVQTLGLSNDYARPEWMIITVLPVPPPPVRPSISIDGSGTGMQSEDDLTYKLGDIIRASGNVARCESEGAPGHVLAEFEQLLQFHVATYMDNDIAGQPQALQKSGRPIKSIRARLKGKEGRLRGNLMGKRVDFSARTVITGDPNLALDEVGVPRSIAKTLTYPEIVTPWNIEKLHGLVKNGPNMHPGAKYIIRDTGDRIDLRHNKRLGEIHLQYGWKVERHIIDGDFIVFNRQPSLHKASMMGHRVRVMPYSTFRLNLSVTSPYNADFDGDEMNLHVPQSEETRSEVSNLCWVPRQILSPAKNGPLMGIVQDSLCGFYKMSRKDVYLNYEDVMNILLWVPDWDGTIPQPAIIKPIPKWTGKQVLSLILPEGLSLHRVDGGKKEPPLFPLTDVHVLIQNGELIFGQMNKAVVGASGGGVVHVTTAEFGFEAALKFFKGSQVVINYWLLHNGFSVGIGDTIPDISTVDAIAEIFQTKKEAVKEITAKAQANDLEPLPGMTVRETFESLVAKELNDARNESGSTVVKRLKDLNNTLAMSNSGSKGSQINIAQMSAAVGQQNVEGKRIPFGFAYRSLPHFTKDDYSPESGGFIENSYLRGLTPTEFYFHAMSGREGLIDTAVKTAETGYIQRRLVKSMEDLIVKYDGTVRNSLGDIVQFVYGEDGMDGSHAENQSLDFLKLSHDVFEKQYRIDLSSSDTGLRHDLVEDQSIFNADSDVQDLFDAEFQRLEEARVYLRKTRGSEDRLPIPVNIARIIETAKRIFKIRPGNKSDLHPSEVIPHVDALLDRLVVVKGNDPLSIEAQYNATLILKAHLRSRLAFKRLINEHNLNRLAFQHVIGEIENRFARALVNPGEMIGVIAAQSIGEPATQMTLNTFHNTGIGSKNVTKGVPRMKEILNCATQLKTPGMKVYQLPEHKNNQESCKKLRSKVELTTLRSVTEKTEIFYDPRELESEGQETAIAADEDMVSSYWIIPEDNGVSLDRQSRWLLRITLSRRMLLDKGLTIQDVASKMKQHYATDMAIIFSDNNADDLIIRCRMILDQKADDEDDETEQDVILKQLETHLLDTLILRGVKGISRCFLQRETVLYENSDGTLVKASSDPKCNEWFLDTTGTELQDVLEIPGVDATRTTSNSFLQVFRVMGIEAARNSILDELSSILTEGAYCNFRHVAILADIMTQRGTVIPITRFGINRADTGALMRCSFEETVEILLDAAAMGELDDCRGVSENVMLGQLAPMGTGEMDILLDQKMLDTVVSDNARLGIMQGLGVKAPAIIEGGATPYDASSPHRHGGYMGSPEHGSNFSPLANSGADSPGGFHTDYSRTPSGYGFGGLSPFGGTSPAAGGYSPASPFNAGGTSPGYSPVSPGYSLSSPAFGGGSPTFAAASPGFSPVSPAYTPTSPNYTPTSPNIYGGRGMGGSPTSPSYTPTSPGYSPSSPAYGGASATPASPNYSPASPAYSPTSPNVHQRNSPSSPLYTPTSPAYGGGGPGQRRFSPTSPTTYSPTSPANYSPTSPANYSPTSPAAYSPTSPVGHYSPSSPKFEGTPASPPQ